MQSRAGVPPRSPFSPTESTRRQSGVTLVEVVIAIGLFGLLFASLFGAFENLLRMNRLAKDMTRATMDAEEILFDLEGVAYADLRDYTPPSLDGLPEETATVTVTNETGGGIDPADDLPPVVRLEVRMQWKDRAGNIQQVFLHTLRGDYR